MPRPENMTEQNPKITLPCDFLVKIIGQDSEDFNSFVKSRVLHHFPNTKDSAWNKKDSSEGRFTSFTVTLHLTDENTLTTLKQNLAEHADFKLML